jgi:hypothetical protein
MKNFIVIEKTGQVNNISLKKPITIDDLYKKCNFRKKDNFDKRHTWKIDENEYVTLFSRNDGRAGTENKYELPPPLDKDLYFGTMAIIKHSSEIINNNKIQDFTKDSWKKIYEKLMGGFEDLNETDESSEEEVIPKKYKTKQGYSKEDGFIVDDNYIDEDTNSNMDDNESSIETDDDSDSEDSDDMSDLSSDEENDKDNDANEDVYDEDGDDEDGEECCDYDDEDGDISSTANENNASDTSQKNIKEKKSKKKQTSNNDSELSEEEYHY